MLIKVNNKYLPDDTVRLIKFFRKNPVIAANKLLIRDGDPLLLMPVQERILNDWWFGRINILTASRGAGKTTLAAVYSALKLLLYPNNKIGIFGPAYRQSKFIFKEFCKLYEDSPLLQECILKAPSIGNEAASCIFKPAGKGITPSELTALPIGVEGSKIRGQRLSEFFLDECAQLPESIFRSVIKPMISTEFNPAKSVKKFSELKKIYGDNIPPSLTESANGYTVITSGYYQFNYWWEEIIQAWQAIKGGNKLYSLRFVPYYDLPPGFMNQTLVTQSRLNDPEHVFLTEWCAEWISDSEGAFPLSLLEACRDQYLIPKTARDPLVDKGKEYVLGIDAGRKDDHTAIVVIELGYPSKLVHIVELEEMEFTEQAVEVFKLIAAFNPTRIYMDAYGGGTTMQDLLAKPELSGFPTHMKIAEVNSDNIFNSGRKILEMCVPSSQFIEDSNNYTKTLLEHGALSLPASVNPIEKTRKRALKGKTKNLDLVQELINQTASVVITQTSTNSRLKYDLPKAKGANTQVTSLNLKKKDLYSAFVLAGFGAYMLGFKPKDDLTRVQGGVVKEVEHRTNKSAEMPSRYTISPIEYNNVKSSNKFVVLPNGGVIISK